MEIADCGLRRSIDDSMMSMMITRPVVRGAECGEYEVRCTVSRGQSRLGPHINADSDWKLPSYGEESRCGNCEMLNLFADDHAVIRCGVATDVLIV